MKLDRPSAIITHPSWTPPSPDFQAVCDSLPMAVLLLSDRGEILYANSKSETLLMASQTVLVSKSFEHYFRIRASLHDVLDSILLEGRSMSGMEATLADARPVTLSFSPYFAAKGKAVEGVVLTVEPIVMNAQEAQSSAILAGMLAHEINNPLASIRASAQMIAEESQDKELAELICREVDRIKRLTQEVEGLFEQRPATQAAVNIHEVLREVQALSTKSFASNTRFTEQYDPSIPDVSGSRDQLIQLFLNLVKNAAEAMEGGGEITLATSCPTDVRMRLPQRGSKLITPILISIRDNGPGIPPGAQETLFIPFASTKPDGKGMGLAICAKIVHSHGGRITFRSKPGETVFEVLLPSFTN